MKNLVQTAANLIWSCCEDKAPYRDKQGTLQLKTAKKL